MNSTFYTTQERSTLIHRTEDKEDADEIMQNNNIKYEFSHRVPVPIKLRGLKG